MTVLLCKGQLISKEYLQMFSNLPKNELEHFNFLP